MIHLLSANPDFAALLTFLLDYDGFEVELILPGPFGELSRTPAARDLFILDCSNPAALERLLPWRSSAMPLPLVVLAPPVHRARVFEYFPDVAAVVSLPLKPRAFVCLLRRLLAE